MYRFRASENKKSKLRAQLFGSGAILREALKAQEILEDEIRRGRGCVERDELQGALHRRQRVDRLNRLHPAKSRVCRM